MIIEELRKIMPFSGKRADRYLVPINNAMGEVEVNTPRRQAYFLAHLAVESGELRFMEEIADGSDYDHRSDLGNTDPEAIRIAALHGSTPGRWWKGHGPMQVTGYKNHKLCGEALRLDLLNEPRLITETQHAFRSAAWFWVIGSGLNLGKAAIAYGVKYGCNLNDLADRGDWQGTQLAINGGQNGADKRIAYRDTGLRVLTGPLT